MLGLAPQLPAADARQQEEIEAERDRGEERRPQRPQEAEREGDHPHAHVGDLAQQLATGERHQAALRAMPLAPGAPSAPVSRSQATVSVSPCSRVRNV